MLKITKSEQAKEEHVVQPDSTCSPKENINGLKGLTVIHVGTSYIKKRKPDGKIIETETSTDLIMSNPRQKTFPCIEEKRILPHPTHFFSNQLIIEEAPFASNSEAVGIELTPDVSIVLNPIANLLNTNPDMIEEPVSPPPSTGTMSTSSFVN